MQDRRKQGKAKLWIVRWRVDGQQRTKAFRTQAEADRYRADLLRAVDRGEPFDDSTGEPASWKPDDRVELTVYAWARRWLADQWAEWQPRTRYSSGRGTVAVRRAGRAGGRRLAADWASAAPPTLAAAGRN